MKTVSTAITIMPARPVPTPPTTPSPTFKLSPVAYEALRPRRAFDRAGPRRRRPPDRYRHPPVAGAAEALARAGGNDRAPRGDGEALSHPFQGRPKLASGADSGRERHGQGAGGQDHPRLRAQLSKALPAGGLRLAGA